MPVSLSVGMPTGRKRSNRDRIGCVENKNAKQEGKKEKRKKDLLFLIVISIMV